MVHFTADEVHKMDNKKTIVLILCYIILIFILAGCLSIPVPSKIPLSALFFIVSIGPYF